MFDEYRVHLENLPLPTFATLVEATRRTNNIVLRQKGSNRFLRRNTQWLMLSNEGEEKFKEEKEEVHCYLTCVLRGIIQGSTQRGNGIIDSTHHHHYFQFQLIKWKPFLQEWNIDGNINLPYVSWTPTTEEKTNPRYCHFHRSVGHSLAECSVSMYSSE